MLERYYLHLFTIMKTQQTVYRNFESRAVRRSVDLVDLEKINAEKCALSRYQ